MLVALHKTLENLLRAEAPEGSLLARAKLDFSVPDADFRGALETVTLNLYLHEVRENLEVRRAGSVLRRSADRARAERARTPALLDCGYCVTAWSASASETNPVFEEHRLLGEVITLLMKYQRIPQRHWHEDIGEQMGPYPTVVAQPEAFKNPAEFWTAVGSPPKPILTYVVTIAVPLHDEGVLDAVVGSDPEDIQVDLANRRPPAMARGI